MLIYLDNHATTRLDPRVFEAMLPWLKDQYGNAGSLTHAFGRAAREAVEQAREQVAQAIGATAREVIFTSGATESANLAILGAAARPGREIGKLISWQTEHHAVLDPLEHLASRGSHVEILGVAGQKSAVPGLVCVDTLQQACSEETFLVSLLLANNEIGTIQPAAEVAAVAHAVGAVLHLDAAQAVGKVPIDVDQLGADLLSLSAHKFHGPQGVGALFVRRRERVTRLSPRVFGGGQERGLRSGTLNVPGIVGLGAAAELASSQLEQEATEIRHLRDRLWRQIAERIPEARLNGPACSACLCRFQAAGYTSGSRGEQVSSRCWTEKPPLVWSCHNMAITLTEKAASEVKKIIVDQKLADETVLRIGVQGGGCSGFSYSLGFDNAWDEKADSLEEQHGVKVVVDKKSDLFLDGTTLDFHEGIDKRGFTFDNPNAKKSCGCGSSFQA
ncbi:aminotransferase class V-fold PLP-dependent enzyme [bacterium]|nr:aminotransferase class V-fold PLP-dependent enzyme [bacterium]